MAQTLSDSNVVTGELVEQAQGSIVLKLPGTDYLLHLAVDKPIEPDATGRVTGRIRARARKVHCVATGGRFIEPSWGRPRIVQGVVTATDGQARTLTVRCVVPFECTLTTDQNADDFAVGQLVNFGVEPGATFDVSSK